MANELAGLRTGRNLRRPQGQAPVWPIAIVIRHELAKDRSELLLVQHDQVVETLPPEGPHHALGDGIRLWRPARESGSRESRAFASAATAVNLNSGLVRPNRPFLRRWSLRVWFVQVAPSKPRSAISQGNLRASSSLCPTGFAGSRLEAAARNAFRSRNYGGEYDDNHQKHVQSRHNLYSLAFQKLTICLER